MSRKRVLSTAFLDVECVPPHVEDCDCEYFRPGCYCTPQLVQFNQPAPFNYAFSSMEPCFPCCTTATYVVDACGRIYYVNDIEHRLEAPSFMMPSQTNPFEIPLMPHIDEDDYYDPPEIPYKRERFDEDSEDQEDRVSFPDKSTSEKCPANVYRSKRGYLVEEPVDPNDAKQIKKKKISRHGK